MKKSIVIFGAGKIGRSFIGQLFSRSGYEVTFIDINKKVINALNSKNQYSVIIKGIDGDENLTIKNVNGILGSDTEKIVRAIVKADAIAVSVGKMAIIKILPVLGKGIEDRYIERPQSPIDIILAENMRDADKFVSNELIKILPQKLAVEKYIGLIETSIGKMAPIMPKEVEEKDPLIVYAEPYNTLILDKKAFKNPIPDVDGLSPKENMKAWVDRKLFIHNLGHAATAYLGFQENPSATYLWEVLANPSFYEKVKATMQQSAQILMKEHPREFTVDNLDEHITDLLARFQNKALGDTIFRVGCDLYRKLGPQDRIVTVIKSAIKHNQPFGLIYNILVAATHFEAEDENGQQFEDDIKFLDEYATKGLEHILKKICQFTKTEVEKLLN